MSYDGKLKACKANSLNRIAWNKCLHDIHGIPLPSKGLIFDPVFHEDCKITCEEEALRIKEIVDSLIGGKYWIHSKSGEICNEITKDDIIVTSPFNAQVNLLKRHLKGKARVGTVDIMQGQEAAIAIYSLTSSTIEDAPRGTNFILGDRFNVAISRTKCLSIVVGCPTLAEGKTKKVADAEDINRLCTIINKSKANYLHRDNL